MKEQLIKKLVKKGVGVLTAMVMVAGFTLPVLHLIQLNLLFMLKILEQ